MRVELVVGLAAALSMVSYSAHAKKKPDFKPGQWETTIMMEIPGMPMAMPPITMSSCLTEKDLVPDTSQPGQDCKTTKQKVNGNNVEWTIQCKDKDGNRSTMSGKGTYTGDTFNGTMRMAMSQAGRAGMQMTYKISSKRVGPCKKPKP